MADDREQRGLALAALYRIDHQDDGKYVVPSQSGDGTKYVVDPDPEHPSCNCPDHRDRGIKCKHMFAVGFVMTRETAPNGTTTVTKTTIKERVTYKQNWKAYEGFWNNPISYTLGTPSNFLYSSFARFFISSNSSIENISAL